MSILFINMNETMSLLLATTILAIGGVGLYMYKSDEQEQIGGEDYNSEDGFFTPNDDSELDDANDIDYYEPRIKSRAGKPKTKRNRKGIGTKRRY